MSNRPRALSERVRILAAQNGDPLLAAFEITERLTQEQAQQHFDMLLAEGAETPMGLAFSAGEADLLQLLAARLTVPLVWRHVVIAPDGAVEGEGRCVEERERVG